MILTKGLPEELVAQFEAQSVPTIAAVPAAECYVMADNEKLSNWGLAKGYKVTNVVPCVSGDQADFVMKLAVLDNNLHKPRVVSTPPRPRIGRILSITGGAPCPI